jgi:hypothetical protein
VAPGKGLERLGVSPFPPLSSVSGGSTNFKLLRGLGEGASKEDPDDVFSAMVR